MWNISLQALLHLGVIMIVAVLLHFMYILTIPSDMKLLKHISDWALGKYLCACFHLLVNKCHKNYNRLSLLSLCSWIGLFKSGIRLGESSSDVWSDKHSIKTGLSGPSQTTQMHYNALCVL